mgnify:CR=1 FL=1
MTYSDGKTQKTVVTLNGNGTESVTVTGRDGSDTRFTREASGRPEQGQHEATQPSRRINWREVVRQ